MTLGNPDLTGESEIAAAYFRRSLANQLVLEESKSIIRGQAQRGLPSPWLGSYTECGIRREPSKLLPQPTVVGTG